jgi:cytidyltransferase-like protein
MRYGARYSMMSGRFQPFHLGHLAYLRLLLKRPEPLLVGITNPDPTFIREDPASAHRHLLESNPFSYFERFLMVRETLSDEGVPADRYAIIPFPINVPAAWRYYLPRDAVQFVPVFSDWERRKAEAFREAGFGVEIIDSLEKSISATEVRERIRREEAWEQLVPKGVARVVRELLAAGHQV